MSVRTHYFTLISVWTWAFHHSNKVHTTQHDFAEKKEPVFLLTTYYNFCFRPISSFCTEKKNQPFSSSVLGPEAEFNNYTG
jgi:hypothetical protein